MHISRSSNFSAELDKVKAFYDGLGKIDSTYKGTIVPIQDKITGFSCSSWTDNVGDQMLTLVKGIKESEIVTLDDNQTIGGFKQLVDNTVALKDALGNCVTCEAQIKRDESTMASEARKRKEGEGYSSLYYSAKSDKENTETQLNGLIETANTLIGNYPNIHFNGAGFQLDGAQQESQEDSGAEEASQDDFEAKRQKAAEMCDFEWMRENMYFLYDTGLGCSIAVTCGDMGSVYLIKDGNTVRMCDMARNPIPNTPTFTLDQVAQGKASYPEVESAVAEYFASQME